MNTQTNIVRIPFGSHLYGTATPSSDYDFKVIYLPPMQDLILGKKFEIYKEKPGGAGDTMKAGEVETEFAPIQRLAMDFFSGQSWAIECVFAILSNEYEMMEPGLEYDLQMFCQALSNRFLVSNLNAMVSYAMHQSQMYGVKAERLNAIDRLIGVLEKVDRAQYTRLADIKLILETLVDGDTISFVTIKGTNHTYNEQPALRVNNRDYPMASMVHYLHTEMFKVRQRYGERVRKAQGAEVDWKALSHAIRVVSQACNLLEFGKIDFPLPCVDTLLKVKNGEVPFEVATEMFAQLNTRMEELKKTTKLPERTPELKKDFEYWLSNELLINWYN